LDDPHLLALGGQARGLPKPSDLLASAGRGLMLRREKSESAAAVDPGELVLCVESFRPAPVSALIERGRYVRRDAPAVVRFPQFFRALVPVEKAAK
jgi:hypothetical protein